MNQTIIAEEKSGTEREINERELIVKKATEQFDLEYQKWTKMSKRIRNSFVQFSIETFYKTSGRLLNQDIRKAIIKLSWIEEKQSDLTVETKFENRILTVRVNL